jgi:hypothetical protein
MYFPRNWEFGSALSKLRNNFGGGGFEPPNPPLGTPVVHAATDLIIFLFEGNIQIANKQLP